MPQARFLGRRWRLSTDSLPLLFYPLLTGLSVVMFVLLLSLVATTLSSNYQCSEFAKVGVAMYGMTAIYFCEIVVFVLIIRFGWMYGPLNESKRMPQMSIFIHVWILVVIVKLVFTCWGIFVVYSPTVSRECWSSNPCAIYSDQLPKVCVPGATGNVELTPSCQAIVSNLDDFNACFEKWAKFGGGWMIDNFVGMYSDTDNVLLSYSNFTYPGTVTCSTVDWENDKRLAAINPYDNTTSIFMTLFVVLRGIDDFIRQEAPNETTLVDILPSAYQSVILRFISNGIYDDKNLTLAELDTKIPWNICLSDYCRDLLQNDCEQWRTLETLPETYKISGWFAAIMYISLAVCILTGFLFIITFNAFPDYESEESWHGLLSGVAKRLGFLEELRTTATHDGVDALVGIGGLLHSLFGGADLDFTDLLLGLYLVHLRQKWKRKEHALLYVARHGYDGKEKEINIWRSWIVGFIMFPSFSDRYHGWWWTKRKTRGSDKKKSAMSSERSSSLSQIDGEILDQLSTEFEHIWVHNDSNGIGVGEERVEDKTRGDVDSDANALTLRHSFVRIESLASETSKERIISTQSNNLVKLVKQERAMITPLNLHNVTFEIDDASKSQTDDFVSLYLGKPSGLVDAEILKETIHFLPIARASYGLMKFKWKTCVETTWRYKMQTKMIGCFQRCIPASIKESYHRERNLQYVIRMIGCNEDDILYASYTSSALAVIPYLIFRDTSTKNICISIRGTVGAADLITDLVSNPIDISDMFNSEKELYAHAGVASSTMALIDQFKHKGIWEAFRDQDTATKQQQQEEDEQPHGGNSMIMDRDDDDDNGGHSGRFSLARAKDVIREAIHQDGYGVVITGHSLGAAVACLVAGAMRTIHPTLRCIAYNPPGGLVDENLRALSKTYCNSVVCGQDAISRMSLGTLKRVIDDMMFALASCKRPKLSILFDSIIGRYVNTAAASHVFGTFDDIEPDVLDVLKTYLQKSKFHQKHVDHRPMYPPGNIIFLRPYGDPNDETKDASWDAVWLRAKDLMDEGLLLSRSMWRHHLLVHVLEALETSLETEEKRSMNKDGTV
ncbi:Sn1-specific diacylglycerol lipase alpha [Picochlorum sp. SENEW3]|nr:Sn1-specific diacylglycerol lipase alpha [Picochlorum sp. SENEW3]